MTKCLSTMNTQQQHACNIEYQVTVGTNQNIFEACSASIAARATNLTGIYESENGWKGELISLLYVKSIKDIPLFIQMALSLFSLEHSDCTTLWRMHTSNCREKVTTATKSFEVVASLPHICPLFSSIYLLFSHYHLDRTKLQKIPASSTLACKYIVGHFFVRSSFLLHSTHVCCCCAFIVERL